MPLVTDNVNVWVVVPPAPKALTVTRYEPAGLAFVTRTAPVVGLAAKVPLKLLFVETLMLVAPVGALPATQPPAGVAMAMAMAMAMG